MVANKYKIITIAICNSYIQVEADLRLIGSLNDSRNLDYKVWQWIFIAQLSHLFVLSFSDSDHLRIYVSLIVSSLVKLLHKKCELENHDHKPRTGYE